MLARETKKGKNNYKKKKSCSPAQLKLVGVKRSVIFSAFYLCSSMRLPDARFIIVSEKDALLLI